MQIYKQLATFVRLVLDDPGAVLEVLRNDIQNRTRPCIDWIRRPPTCVYLSQTLPQLPVNSVTHNRTLLKYSKYSNTKLEVHFYGAI